jgi:hypothetical protein
VSFSWAFAIKEGIDADRSKTDKATLATFNIVYPP